jgi:predicted rRNA methylase YqxC with S4 and FtsJ domains
MSLYKRLKENNLVINEKEFRELIHIREIKIDGKHVIDPDIQLEEDKKYKVKIGILTKEI